MNSTLSTNICLLVYLPIFIWEQFAPITYSELGIYKFVLYNSKLCKYLQLYKYIFQLSTDFNNIIIV